MNSFRIFFEEMDQRSQLEQTMKELDDAYEKLDPFVDDRNHHTVTGTVRYMPPEQVKLKDNDYYGDSLNDFAKVMANQNRRIAEGAQRIAQSFNGVRDSYSKFKQATQNLPYVFQASHKEAYEDPNQYPGDQRVDREMFKVNKSMINKASIYLETLAELRNGHYAMQKVMNKLGDGSSLRDLSDNAPEQAKDYAWKIYESFMNFRDAFSRFTSVFETYAPAIHKELTAMLPRLNKHAIPVHPSQRAAWQQVRSPSAQGSVMRHDPHPDSSHAQRLAQQATVQYPGGRR